MRAFQPNSTRRHPYHIGQFFIGSRPTSPTTWWRPLAIVGASLLMLVMMGFFGPTKILPILAALTIIWAATLGSDAVNLA
jgi:hypothetical protein